MAEVTASAAAAPAVPSGPNTSVIKGPCNRVSSLGVVLKSTACLVGFAYGLDFVLKANLQRNKQEHDRRHEFESILGEIRSARQAKFEQARPVVPESKDGFSLFNLTSKGHGDKH